MKENVIAISGIIVILTSIILGLYYGIWVFFIGGIVELVTVIRSPNFVSSNLCWPILKILLAGSVTQLFTWFGIVSGIAILKSNK